jgi:ComF family protein
VRGGAAVAGFLSFLFDLIVPRSCLVCGRELVPFDLSALVAAKGGGRERLRDFLTADLRFDLFPGLSAPGDVLCPGCWSKLERAAGTGVLAVPGGFEVHVPLVSPFFTNDELLGIVRFLKFSAGRTAAPALGWWMAAALGDYLHNEPGRGAAAPLLVPVPLHASRERSRGYNQASLLAGEVAGRLGLEVESRILRRVRNTKSQSTLESDARAANMEGAFGLVRPDLVNSKNIIVVDDLVTTGETVLACVAALQEGAPFSIAVLSAGRVRD